MWVALSLFAALFVYGSGKQAGLWAAMAVAERWKGGVDEGAGQALWYGLDGLAMQLGGGGACGILWRKQIPWKAKGTGPAGGEGRRTGLAVLLGLAAASALGLNLLLTLLRLPSVSETFQETASAQAAVPMWLGLLLYGLVSPFSEEVMFRGILYGGAEKAFGPGIAMVFSAVVFAVYHGNLVQGVYAFLLGMLLAYVCEKAGTIWAAVLFHGVGNVTVYLLIDVWGMGGIGTPFRILLCVLMLAVAGGCFFLMVRIGKRRGGE